MKITGASLVPTSASISAGKPQLTAELMAAVAANYSRSNKGLQAILAKIDRNSDPDKVVDTIFKFIDFGHQSIGDSVPVAIFIDGISEILAYMIWAATPVQTAAGQESSTRYIKLAMDGIIDPTALGIPEHRAVEWNKQNARAFEAYDTALAVWTDILEKDPELARIPGAILNQAGKEKQVARMKRNYALDRARVYLPVGVATNMFLLMSARSWVALCQHLLSCGLTEAVTLGEQLVEELELFAPRMIKYAVYTATTDYGICEERHQAVLMARDIGVIDGEKSPDPHLDVMLPRNVSGQDLAKALKFHDNRYAWVGSDLCRASVRFSWDAVGLAEIRDLNRHGPGNKYCPLVPQGFHSALDQCPGGFGEEYRVLHSLKVVGHNSANFSLRSLREDDPSYVYWMQLGTQLPFEHLTTGDKFVYIMELRTGTGSHYRYARHCHDLLELWYDRFPETKGKIIEGSAEPE